MTDSFVQQWITRQQSSGLAVCLILDSQNEQDACRSLLASSAIDQFRNVYRATSVEELADVGPFVFSVTLSDYRRLDPLLGRPHDHWGWLASIAQDQLPELIKHWQARMVIGTSPHQALYRFQDNRVLAKALQRLPQNALPAYLGPAVSACYWNGSHWHSVDNPDPGTHPVPEQPMWLTVPPAPEQAIEVRQANAHRYLLAEHEEAYTRLAEQFLPQDWLGQRLVQADIWHWQSPAQLHFLLTQSLQAPGYELPGYWQPQRDESPDEHFERVSRTVKFWQSEVPL